jgi:hypothetical protein
MTYKIFVLTEDESTPMCVGQADDPEIAARIFVQECDTTRNALSKVHSRSFLWNNPQAKVRRFL